MIAYIRADGELVVTPEGETENYALLCWFEKVAHRRTKVALELPDGDFDHVKIAVSVDSEEASHLPLPVLPKKKKR